ncbi:MAG: right-handed parallel beta-helix repeat-containing protein [Anaerolineae bacterium]|nr:right-handed parallel beta-helix repeat-containing protein [Anaerolineae bacterium]
MIQSWRRFLRLLVSSLLVWVIAVPVAAWSSTRYIAPDGDCISATPCYATLQAAIDAAAPGDEIRVAQGVYTTVSAFQYPLGGWTQTITQALFIDKTLTVRGGYTTTDWTTAQPASYPTVIDPHGRGRGGVISAPDESARITVTLEGLIFANGYAGGSGGGLYVEGASVVISDCYIHHNHGGSLASGAYLSGDTMTLTRNRIENNTGDGHGIVVDMGVPTLSDNRIVSNTNGLLLWNNCATLINNVIAANAETGLTVIGGEMQAWHTTLAGNGAVGVWAQNSGQGPAHATMTNTILTGPAVGMRAVGHSEDPTTVQLTATLWRNLTDTQSTDTGGQIVRSRDFAGDPAFVGVDDYRLTAASPARNRGASSGVAFDISGVPRDPLPDLGAYEYNDPGSIRQVYMPLVLR